jgi:hypothetical protein
MLAQRYEKWCKNEWTQKWPYEKDALESTLCVVGVLIGWLWQIQNLYHWPQSKLERKSKTMKREFLDPRVTNITSGKKTIIIIKSTDISLDRQALSASVIWFETLPRDHQLSWRKLLKTIILADPKFISLTTIQVGKKIKDNEERVFGSASYKHYIRKA